MSTDDPFDTAWLFPRRTAAFLNLWYRSYAEAREVLEQYPTRYLFPFRNQFVVCERSMLEHLAIDTNDPDWVKIGHDWYEPQDMAAHHRLSVLLRAKLKEPGKLFVATGSVLLPDTCNC